MVRNFLFHRVNPERDKLWDPMDVALFDRCILFITKNYKVVLLEEMLENSSLQKEKKLATILFDDGYKDNLTYAAPILAKYKVKASFYVVTDCIEKNIPTWTNILEHLFQHTTKTELLIDFDFLPDNLKIKQLNSASERMEYVKKLKPALKKLKDTQRDAVLKTIVESYKDVKLPELMMNWEDLKELKRQGHYIGSHTVTHCMLGTMENENDIKAELQNSAKAIEMNLGHFPKTISYPVGSYSETAIKLSKDAGYKFGLAVKQDVYHPDSDSIFEIPRIELYNEPWWKTRLRISNTLEVVKKKIGYK